MPDSLGMADVRGLDIDRALKGYADESFIFKDFLTVTPTANREIRWWRKTSGVLDSTDTTGITASQIRNAFGTLPPIVEQTATRLTSQVQHFSAQTPLFSYADIRDSDPDMFAANLRDLKRAIENQIDFRILDTLSGSVLLSGGAMGTGWDDTSAGNPFMDLLSGAMEIRKQGYDISNVVAWIHPNDFKAAIDYFVTTKGSSIPQFASGVVQDGVITRVANVRIVVSNNCTEKQVLMLVPQRAATWKQFTPLTAVTIEDPLLGARLRAAEDGEVIFTDPNAACLLVDV